MFTILLGYFEILNAVSNRGTKANPRLAAVNGLPYTVTETEEVFIIVTEQWFNIQRQKQNIQPVRSLSMRYLQRI